MKKVLINVDFKDRYTGEMHKAGATEEMSEERIAEVKEVNPNFISVVGNVEEPVQAGDTEPNDEKPNDEKSNDEKSDDEKSDGKKEDKKAK